MACDTRPIVTLLLCGAVLAGLGAAEVRAQSGGKVAVGASVSTTNRSIDSSLRGVTRLRVLLRLGQGRDGWGWKYGLNWYSADLDATLDGRRESFGKLKVRPVMGGYGYSHVLGRTRISTDVLAGYALTSFSLQPSYDHAYRQLLAVGAVKTESSNTFVVKPEVSAWMDLSRTAGLNFSAGYMIARPTVTVISPLGWDRHRVNADTFMLRVGAVYSIF